MSLFQIGKKGYSYQNKSIKRKISIFIKIDLLVGQLGFCRVFKNHNNYIISLANLCRWLATEAENLGVEIFPGFAASKILYSEDNTVVGVQTGDMGIDKNGNKKDSYEPGIDIKAKVTVFAEGCRGHLGKELIKKYNLSEGKSPQQYGIGFKEIWEIDETQHNEGMVMHTAGWPLDNSTYGGSFCYHAEKTNFFRLCYWFRL